MCEQIINRSSFHFFRFCDFGKVAISHLSVVKHIVNQSRYLTRITFKVYLPSTILLDDISPREILNPGFASTAFPDGKRNSKILGSLKKNGMDGLKLLNRRDPKTIQLFDLFRRTHLS